MKTRKTQRRKKNLKGAYRQPIAYRDYLRTNHWEAVRKRYQESNLEQYCIACGTKGFQLHHIVYDRLWRELPGDLIPLCGNCHQRIHWYLTQNRCPREQIWTILHNAFELIPETRIVRISRRFKAAQERGSEISPAACRKAWLAVRRCDSGKVSSGRPVS